MGYHRGSCTVRRTWIGCARRKTAQHFRKQLRLSGTCLGIDLFSHISTRILKMMPNFHVILRPATWDPPGDVPHLKQLWRFGEPSVRAKDVTVLCGFCWPTFLQASIRHPETQENLAPQCHHSPENEGLIEGVWSPSLFVNNPRSLGQLGRLFPGIRFSWCWKQIWSSWNLVMPWWFLAWTSSDHWMSYCWWREIRGSPVEVDSLSHCLHGCKNARWLAGFLSHQQ